MVCPIIGLVRIMLWRKPKRVNQSAPEQICRLRLAGGRMRPPLRDQCKIYSLAVLRRVPSFERISPMATLEAPVRPRTSLHQGPFVTEPFFDFRNEENARKMRSAIAKVRAQLGREYDLVIGGK